MLKGALSTHQTPINFKVSLPLKTNAGQRTRLILLAIDAALFSVEHKLPMADSIIYATAREHDAELITLDAHFKGLDGIVWLESKL